MKQTTGYRLATAHLLARRAFNQALEPLEIQAKHLGVLMALTGDRTYSQKQIADHLDLDKSSVVLIVDDLERLGLAVRRPDPRDRRAHVLEITGKGRQRLAAAEKIAAELDQQVFAGFSRDERKRLDQALERIMENCR